MTSLVQSLHKKSASRLYWDFAYDSSNCLSFDKRALQSMVIFWLASQQQRTETSFITLFISGRCSIYIIYESACSHQYDVVLIFYINYLPKNYCCRNSQYLYTSRGSFKKQKINICCQLKYANFWAIFDFESTCTSVTIFFLYFSKHTWHYFGQKSPFLIASVAFTTLTMFQIPRICRRQDFAIIN